MPVVHRYGILCTTANSMCYRSSYRYIKGSPDSRWSLDMTVTLDFFVNTFFMHGF